MKKIISIICIVCMLASCEKENGNTNLKVVDIETLAESKIGKDFDGEFKFTATEASILKAFDVLLNTHNDKPLIPESVKVETIDSQKYLRIYSKNNFVSTIRLILDSDNNYVTQNTVCTFAAYASGGGCIPDSDGVYCTPCKIGVNGNLSGDCSRTTTTLNLATNNP
jgi:hypothetical protein